VLYHFDHYTSPIFKTSCNFHWWNQTINVSNFWVNTYIMFMLGILQDLWFLGPTCPNLYKNYTFLARNLKLLVPWGWDCSSVVQQLPSMEKALD
jgi:hypothetical protein